MRRTGQPMATAFAIARPGSTVGAIRCIGQRGGVSPARRSIPDLLR
jgi:hypothetical protein